MTMSTAKACAYFFCFTAFKFLLCIYQFYFWFVFFWQHIQLFGPTNQSDVASLCKARLCLGTAVSGTASSQASLGATFFLFELYCGCSPRGSVIHYQGSFIKEKFFHLQPSFLLFVPPHFFVIHHHSSLHFNQELLTTYPPTLILHLHFWGC